MKNLHTIHSLIKLLAICIFLFFTLIIHGQNVYLSSNQNEIYRIDSAYLLTYITTVSYQEPLDDIAISPEGSLYGISGGELMEINVEDGSVQVLFTLPGYDMSSSLVCSNDAKLYMRGRYSNVFYEYDIAYDTIRLINYLGDDMANDMTFYRGNILFPSQYKYEIQSYDIRKQEFNQIACQPILSFQGISNVLDSCGNELVYLIDYFSRLWEFNSNDQQPYIVYHYWLTGRHFLGMASSSEHLASECYSYLPPITCEYIVGVKDTPQKPSILLFPNPATNFFTVQCSAKIEELRVYNLSGVLVKTIFGSNPTADVRDLINGIYLVQVYANGIWFPLKLVIQ